MGRRVWEIYFNTIGYPNWSIRFSRFLTRLTQSLTATNVRRFGYMIFHLLVVFWKRKRVEIQGTLSRRFVQNCSLLLSIMIKVTYIGIIKREKLPCLSKLSFLHEINGIIGIYTSVRFDVSYIIVLFWVYNLRLYTHMIK